MAVSTSAISTSKAKVQVFRVRILSYYIWSVDLHQDQLPSRPSVCCAGTTGEDQLGGLRLRKTSTRGSPSENGQHGGVYHFMCQDLQNMYKIIVAGTTVRPSGHKFSFADARSKFESALVHLVL